MRGARRSKAPAIVAGIVVLGALIIVAVLFLKPNRPAAAPGKAITLTIEDGIGSAGVADKLKSAGLIDSTLLFRFHLLRLGARSQLQSGTHHFIAGWSYARIILELRQATGPPAVKVTFPEGQSIAQMDSVLQDKLGLPAQAFSRYAAHAAPDFVARYPFLADAYDGSLQGFLFPDTYEFAADITPAEVCAEMLARFWSVYSKLEAPATSPTGEPFAPADYVTVASLVEKEVSVPSERPLVASVIYNRLERDMKLQLCSTVQFLLPGSAKNKLRLTEDDVATPSPFNTYLNFGLPPGPIANPGKAALEAAIRPAQTSYLFFVLTGKDGSQTFASTPEEFAAAQAKSQEVFGR
ncbi:MAG: endolytic transglycosylase MltG [Actinomycetia bacterium]|nr:endolytic transglycosylase MltG [Actinomycetes bacterium]